MLGMARRHALIVVARLVVAAILLIGDRVEIPIPAFAAPSVTREMSAHFGLAGVSTLEVDTGFADLTLGSAQTLRQAGPAGSAAPPLIGSGMAGVDVTGKVRGYRREAVDDVRIALDRSGERATLRLDPTDRFGRRGLSGDFSLQVPDHVALLVRTSNGDITVNGHAAALDVSTGNGDLRLRGISGAPLRVGDGNGDIAVGFAPGWTVSHVQVYDGNGDITLELPGAVAPTLYTSIGSGDLHDGANLPRADRSVADFVLRTGNGDITIRRKRL